MISTFDLASARVPRRFAYFPRNCRPRVTILALVLACSSAAFGETTAQLPTTTVGPLIISSDIPPGADYFSIINLAVGADRFYNNGYFGFNTLVANVEAGYVWNGHETLGNVTSFVSNSPLNATANQYDYHATMVGFVLTGLGPPDPSGNYFYYQFGMAPGAFLSSVAIATSFNSDGSFGITSSSLVYGYKTAMLDGVPLEFFPGFTVTRVAEVVNSSWGFEDPTGSQQPTMIVDALTYQVHQTVCVAAGNHESGTALVGGPASGFNTISVGALGNDLTNPPYQNLAPFSNTGPNDFYNPATGETIHGVRAAVSISAPGTDLFLPAYTGSTGTNSSGTLFDTTGIPADQLNQLYFSHVNGTSFASPIVAGGAALLVDAGYDNFGARFVEGRIIKAVLLNSADKTPGWTNNSVMINGVLTTHQGLDWNVGAGALNLNKAYDQYLSGTTDVVGMTGGTVHPLGWDLGNVAAGAPNIYIVDTPLHQGDTLTATLDWFINVHFNTDAIADPITDAFSDADLGYTYFDQLDLQVWEVTDGQLSTLIAESWSPYNNVDHLYFPLPEDGVYALRVSYLGTTYDLTNSSPHNDDYGLAWSVTPVPEPASFLLLAPVAWLLSRRRRHA